MTYRPVSGAVAVAVAWLVCWAVSGCGRDRHAAALEKYRKLDEGMTLQEVEAILGPGEDSTDPWLLSLQKEMKLPESVKWKKWKVDGNDERVYIGLAFDEGKVVFRMRRNF
jgi:hypothetical protein